MLSYAGKPRSPYAGMSESELDAELAIGDIEIAAKKLESAVKAVESEAIDKEVDLLQMEDEVVDAKVNTIVANLQKKYPDRDLTIPELMYELNYNQHKAKDFLQVIGKATVSNVAMMIVADANDKTLREDNREKLLSYLTAKYSGYEGVPVEYIGSELLMDDKEALKLSKKLMGKHYATKVMFIDFSVVVDIILESI